MYLPGPQLPVVFTGTPLIGRTTVPSFIEICRSAETSASRAIIDASFPFHLR